MLPPAMSAGGDGMSRSMVIAVTLLPQPDSPTSPSVPPRGTSKDTPSTARVRPSRLANQTSRSSTATMGSAPMAVVMPRSQTPRDLRVEHVAEPVAEQVDRQHGHAEKEAREHDEAERQLHDRASLGHHVAPARDLGRCAGAEEGQVGLEQH